MPSKLTIPRGSLDEPMSVDTDGRLATMRDCIAAYGHPDVRASAGDPAPDPARAIKACRDLSDAELTAIFEAAMGDDTDELRQLRDAVRARTPFGRQFLKEFRSLLESVEKGIRDGSLEFEASTLN